MTHKGWCVLKHKTNKQLYRLCRVATQNNWNIWSMGFDLHDSISGIYLFLTSAMEIRVCQNSGAMNESMLSDVHIGENAPPPPAY